MSAERTPSPHQLRWLCRGWGQPGGKLPLFDENGQKVSRSTVEACLKAGWAEPWQRNPIKPDWLVCRLTPAGRVFIARILGEEGEPGQGVQTRMASDGEGFA